MIKDPPHEIVNFDELGRMLPPGQSVEDVAVPIPPEELDRVRKMNRRARQRWLRRQGMTLTEYRAAKTVAEGRAN